MSYPLIAGDINKGGHTGTPPCLLAPLLAKDLPPTPQYQTEMGSEQASAQYSQIPRGKHSSPGVSPPPCPHLRFAFRWPFPAIPQFI